MFNMCLFFNIDKYLFFKLHINIIGLKLEKLEIFPLIFLMWDFLNFLRKIFFLYFSQSFGGKNIMCKFKVI